MLIHWLFVTSRGFRFALKTENLETRPPEVIVLRHGEGPDDPEQFSSTFFFEERTDGTRVILRSEFKTKALRDRAAREYGAIEGANQTLDSLATYVAERLE